MCRGDDPVHEALESNQANPNQAKPNQAKQGARVRLRCSVLQLWSDLGWALVAIAFCAGLYFALCNRTILQLCEYVSHSLGTQSKTVWSFAQIMSEVSALLFTLLPGTLRHFYSSLQVTNFDVTFAFALACMNHSLGSYFADLVFTTLTPIAIALLIWITYVIRVRVLKQHDHDCSQQHFQAFLVLCYLALPEVCTVTFAAFQCASDFGPSDASYLRADFGTDCHSDEYRRLIKPWAIVSVLVYPIGVNGMYMLVLYNNKELIKHGGAKHIGFLHDAYTRDAWFWEPIDSLRRISLTGLLVCFGSDESRVVAAVLLSFCWVVIYHHASPFARSDDRLIADIANFQILFVMILLEISQGSLIKKSTVAALCIGVNLALIPAVAFFQLNHAWRGWQVVQSLKPGTQINESFNEEWFMRSWEAGGGVREFLRDRTVAWLESALRSPSDEATCHSILHVLRLPPFQSTESFGEDDMGIVVMLHEAPCFAVLTPCPVALAERRSSPAMHDQVSHDSTTSGLITGRDQSGNQPLLSINVHLQSGEGPCRNARLKFTNTARRDIDVHWTSSSGYLIEYQGRQIRFDTVLFYVLQTLVDKGQARPLLDENVILLGRPSWRPTEFPLHVLFMSQLITVQVLVILITEAGPMALLQRDNAGKFPFYFLKHRGDGRRANELPARTEQTIADLIVGLAEAEPTLVQLLLQQAAANGYVTASQVIIERCGGRVDDPSAFDPRTPRMIGKDALDAATRDFYDDRDAMNRDALVEQRHELYVHHERARLLAVQEKQRELLTLFERKDEERHSVLEEKRCRLFSEAMFGNAAGNSGDALEPFSLPAGELDRSRARRFFSHALRHSTTPLTHGAMSRDGLFRRAADLAS